MRKVVIFGTNDVSQLAAFYFKHDTRRKPSAFCVDGDFLKESKIDGRPVVALEEVVKHYPPDQYYFFVPLYDNKLREIKAAQVKNLGYRLISYVSSKATVWSSVGENCFIMEDNTIQPFVKIGNNVIMWSGNHIGHHSVIKDNVFFSSHVVLSGHCVVENYCWFGVNSTIRDHITLAEGTYVAMGASITKNTEVNKKYRGVPAKEYDG